MNPPNRKTVILKAMANTEYGKNPDAMIIIGKLIDLGYMSPSEIKTWLETPNKRFEGKKPIDLVNSQDYYNVYSHLVIRANELSNKAEGLNNSNLP